MDKHGRRITRNQVCVPDTLQLPTETIFHVLKERLSTQWMLRAMRMKFYANEPCGKKSLPKAQAMTSQRESTPPGLSTTIDELIDFNVPLQNTLRVDIAPSYVSDGVECCYREVIVAIQVLCSRLKLKYHSSKLIHNSDSSVVLFVNFYSRIAFNIALSEIPMISSKIPFRTRYWENRNPRIIPLNLNDSIELANHYLGFNGWSTSIIHVSITYAIVNVAFNAGSLVCEGRCIANQVHLPFKDPGNLQKTLVSLAFLNAFSNVCIYITADGRSLAMRYPVED